MTDGAPLVIGATLEMMALRGAGRRETVLDWPAHRGLSPEACPPLEVGERARGRVGVRLGLESPLVVASPLSMGLAAVQGVAELVTVALGV